MTRRRNGDSRIELGRQKRGVTPLDECEEDEEAVNDRVGNFEWSGLLGETGRVQATEAEKGGRLAAEGMEGSGECDKKARHEQRG